MEQKFIQVYGNPELHITACAVSKLPGIHGLSKIEGYENYFSEPNQKWLENPANERAWIKVYYKLNPLTDSQIKGRIQIINIPMPFFGESREECWGEIQLCIKKQIVRNDNTINLKNVKIGRHTCFDTRVGKWVEETKPIKPKNDPNSSDRSHYYIALRLYHQNYLPETPDGWHFEPVYVVIAGKDFYRIDIIWQNEEITITVTQLYSDSSEIPKFLK